MRIFVIDDDEFIRRALGTQLRSWKHEVSVFGSADELLPHAGDCPDLVFCDLNLPEVDGLGIAAILRQRSPKTPIVIVSAAWDVPEVRAALEGHLIDRVLAKPWRSEELKSLLAAPLEQPKVG